MPKKIIISLGANNVDCKPDTNKDQIKRLATSLRQTYPQARLLAAPISIDNRLPKTVKNHLKDINTSFFNSRQFENLPPHAMDFTTNTMQWTHRSANDLFSHWIDHLN